MGETSSASENSALAALGFLTIVEHDQWGLIGGYLVLSLTARPLEFHCTAPIKPSRAQQILYGPTLAPYLYGEQIGQVLISKASTQPAAVWTDQAAALCLRDFISLPVSLIQPDEQSSTATSDRVIDPSGHYDTLLKLQFGNQRMLIPGNHAEDRERLAVISRAIATFDLLEPFDRIREAIEEAHKATGNRAA